MNVVKVVSVFASVAILSALPVNAQMMKGEGCPLEMAGKSGKHKMTWQGKGMTDKWGNCGVSGQREGGVHFFLANAKALGLSDEQVKSIKAIKHKVSEEHTLYKAELMAARSGLRDLLEADTVDMEKVEKKVKEIIALKEKLMLTGIKAGIDGKGILTKEQREKAKKLMIEKKKECLVKKGKKTMGEKGSSSDGGEMGMEGEDPQ